MRINLLVLIMPRVNSASITPWVFSQCQDGFPSSVYSQGLEGLFHED